MNDLTIRQHNVSAFYLRFWANEDGAVSVHDLSSQRAFGTGPDAIMARRFFYEEDPKSPDNRIEHMLGDMEGECSPIFQRLADLNLTERVDASAISSVSSILSHENCLKIKTFAAFQYLRIPGAIDQKAQELKATILPQDQKDYWLNAGRFVETGYAYMKDRFLGLKMVVMVSAGQDFLTSDWPCFDMKDNSAAPRLGEEIGRNPEVVGYFSFTPRVAAVFYPENHLPTGQSRQTPESFVLRCSDPDVRNQNTLVIQQADRFVVARRDSPFIFKVAAKRKKAAR